MNRFVKYFWGITCLLLILSFSTAFAQKTTGGLRGQVKDQFGGVIIGATVSAVNAAGVAKTATTGDDGSFVISGLEPGTYTVRSTSQGFAQFEEANVDVTAGKLHSIDVVMQVTIAETKVNVAAETPVSTDPENNQGAVVLRGADLDALPDDPDDLADALQALAGPSAGPNGGQIYIDGFTGGRLPPKASIREIRINQNPFAAEYDRLGFGRIEILTKPGTDKFRGSANFNFNDESLNSKNPFLLSNKRPPFQSRLFGGNLSGPLISKKASFFLDFEKRDIDDNAVINAIVLNTAVPGFPEERVSQGIVTPRRNLTFSPRVDFQIDSKNTLVARYTFSRNTFDNQGIGEFSLAERAFNSENKQNTVQLTETAILSPRVINETRFQFIHQTSDINADNSRPTINVANSFVSGGSQAGQSSNVENRWELQNYTSWSAGRHSLKAGLRIRGVKITDISRNNFGGTFVFAGIRAATGTGTVVTSLDQYRQVLEHAPGATPTQFTINGGNPRAEVSQTDYGVFVQDDWRLKPNLTVSAGLRYENQSNISSNLNFAPRVAIAWSPGGGGNQQPKTVIKAGY